MRVNITSTIENDTLYNEVEGVWDLLINALINFK